MEQYNLSQLIQFGIEDIFKNFNGKPIRDNTIQDLQLSINNYLDFQKSQRNINNKISVKISTNKSEVYINWYYDNEELQDYTIDDIVNFNENLYLFKKDYTGFKINDYTESIMSYKQKENKDRINKILDYCKSIDLNDKQSEYVKNKICNNIRSYVKDGFKISNLNIWVNNDKYHMFESSVYKILLDNDLVICYCFNYYMI